MCRTPISAHEDLAWNMPSYFKLLETWTKRTIFRLLNNRLPSIVTMERREASDLRPKITLASCQYLAQGMGGIQAEYGDFAMLEWSWKFGESAVAKLCKVEFRAEGKMYRARASEIFIGVPFHLQLSMNLHICRSKLQAKVLPGCAMS